MVDSTLVLFESAVAFQERFDTKDCAGCSAGEVLQWAQVQIHPPRETPPTKRREARRRRNCGFVKDVEMLNVIVSRLALPLFLALLISQIQTELDPT